MTIETPTGITGQWVIRRYGDPSPEPYVGPGSHDEISAIVTKWNRDVEHARRTQRNCAETCFYMERVEAPSASQIARAARQPSDHQPKAPRARSGKPGTPIQRAIAAYRNRSVLTVDAFMKSLGADDDTIHRYRGSLGRKIAQAYRAATDSEPVQSGWAVAHHRLIPVFAYGRDQAALLATVARTYKPTATLGA